MFVMHYTYPEILALSGLHNHHVNIVRNPLSRVRKLRVPERVWGLGFEVCDEAQLNCNCCAVREKPTQTVPQRAHEQWPAKIHD